MRMYMFRERLFSLLTLASELVKYDCSAAEFDCIADIAKAEEWRFKGFIILRLE